MPLLLSQSVRDGHRYGVRDGTCLWLRWHYNRLLRHLARNAHITPYHAARLHGAEHVFCADAASFMPRLPHLRTVPSRRFVTYDARMSRVVREQPLTARIWNRTSDSCCACR